MSVPARFWERFDARSAAILVSSGCGAVLPVLAVVLRGQLPLDAAAPLSWVGFSWLGVAFYAFLTLATAIAAVSAFTFNSWPSSVSHTEGMIGTCPAAPGRCNW